MKNFDLKETTDEELIDNESGLTAAGVAIAIGGFIAGVIIGAAAVYVIYLFLKINLL